jgi:hypothetical protein
MMPPGPPSSFAPPTARPATLSLPAARANLTDALLTRVPDVIVQALSAFRSSMEGAVAVEGDLVLFASAAQALRPSCEDYCSTVGAVVLSAAEAAATAVSKSGNVTSTLAVNVTQTAQWYAARMRTAEANRRVLAVSSALSRYSGSQGATTADVAVQMVMGIPMNTSTTVVSGNVTMAGTRRLAGALGNVTVSTNETRVQLPGSFKVPRPGGSNSTDDATLTAIVYRDEASAPGAAEATRPGRFASSFVEVNVFVGDTRANVTGLAEPIRIAMVVNHAPSANETVACTYLNTATQQWTSNGLTLEGFDNATMTATCATTHLTMFTVQYVTVASAVPTTSDNFSPAVGVENDGSGPTKNTTVIVVVVIVAVVIIAAMASGTAVLLMRKRRMHVQRAKVIEATAAEYEGRTFSELSPAVTVPTVIKQQPSPLPTLTTDWRGTSALDAPEKKRRNLYTEV